MRCSTLIFLLGFVGIIHAQKLNVDLSQITLEYGFPVDSVIDSRETKEILGYVFSKGTKNFRTVYPSSPLEQNLQQICTKAKNNNPNTIRIDRLFVYHVLIENDRYFGVEAGLTFIAKDGSDYIETFSASKKIGEYERYGDELILPCIQAALDSCFLHYQKRKNSDKLGNTLIGAKSLQHPYAGANLSGSIGYLPRGLFHSYYDLRDEHLDTETLFETDFRYTDPGQPEEAFLKIKDKAKRKKDIYAFTDGERLYVNTGKVFTEVTDTLNKLWLNNYPGYNYGSGAYTAGFVSSGLMFGIFGAAMYAIIAQKPSEVSNYILDFKRGTVVPYFFPNPEDMHSQTVFYASSFMPKSDTISLSINDALPIKLGKDQSSVYQHKDFSPYKLCIQNKGVENCTEIIPIAYHPTCIRLRINSNGEPQVENVTWDHYEGFFETLEKEKSEPKYY